MDASNVFFNPANMYRKDPDEKAKIVELVVSQAPACAAAARVVNGWHTSFSDNRRHCTVDYFDEKIKFLSREHITEDDNGGWITVSAR